MRLTDCDQPAASAQHATVFGSHDAEGFKATLKIHPGGAHGLAQTQRDEFNADLLARIES